jgi:hypothetical protein
MNYYVVDTENWEWIECEDEKDALAYAEEAIQYYRENCDPEWPMGTEGVVIVFGSRDKDSDEDYDGCKVVYRAVESDIQYLDDEDAEACGYDYTCDYKMEKVDK